MRMKADYDKATDDTYGQTRAWRIGGLKMMLALLCKEFGKEKVKKELDEITKKNYVFKF